MPYVGTVVDGIINAGSLKAGDAILFGPDSSGKFESTVVKSIQRKRCVLCPLSKHAGLTSIPGPPCNPPRPDSASRSR